MIYDVDYFIFKFRTIDAELWCRNNYNDRGKSCALGHCGETDISSTPESLALYSLFESAGLDVPRINDGKDSRFRDINPKLRILAALEFIKANNNKEITQ